MKNYYWHIVLAFVAALPVFGWIYPLFFEWVLEFQALSRKTGEDVFWAVLSTVVLAFVIVVWVGVVLHATRKSPWE